MEHPAITYRLHVEIRLALDVGTSLNVFIHELTGADADKLYDEMLMKLLETLTHRQHKEP